MALDSHFIAKRPATARNPLKIASMVLVILLGLPILVVVGVGLTSGTSVWQHLLDTVLADYVSNSLLLMLGVGVGVIAIGVVTAWLTASCEFYGRRWLSLLLLLPLAMPAYIIAYTYTGLLDFAGPVQTYLREFTGWQYGDYWFPTIRSLGGAITMMVLVLYPYVYLMARAAFLFHGPESLDVARSLGVSRMRGFFLVSLPLARPAIIAGLSLALMETLADYGTVQYFGVSTFTTGIFRTFYGLADSGGAAQLALLLLSFVVALIVLEKYSRKNIRYFQQQDQVRRTSRISLGKLSWVASLVCFVPAFFGFILPAGLLLDWSLQSAEWQQASFFTLSLNSFGLAAFASMLAVAMAVVVAYAARASQGKRWTVQALSLGYALPGTLVALGVLILFSFLDHQLLPIIESFTDNTLGLFFSGSIAALLLAYCIRFVAVALGSVDSGLQAIKPSLTQSAQLMGRTPWQIIREIHIPLMKGSVMTALLIVFVDILKELPATLMLRPFNFNTLAVRAYELASDERLVDAAPAALMIVLVGILPVMLLNRSINRIH